MKGDSKLIPNRHGGADKKQRKINETDRIVKNVGVGEYVVSNDNSVLASYGLGSCVGVVLYDIREHIGSMAHIMLPDSTAISKKGNPGRFADTAIALILEEMIEMGAKRGRIKARMAGGARMFTIPGAKNPMNIPGPTLGLQIGDRNIEASKKKLQELRIPITSSDTGGSHGRTMKLDTETGIVIVSSIRFGEKELS